MIYLLHHLTDEDAPLSLKILSQITNAELLILYYNIPVLNEGTPLHLK
jgi:hypothetical protein